MICQQAWQHTAPTPSQEAATHFPVDSCRLTWAGDTLCNSQTGKEIKHPPPPPSLGAAPSGLPAGGWGFHLGEGLLLGSLEGKPFPLPPLMPPDASKRQLFPKDVPPEMLCIPGNTGGAQAPRGNELRGPQGLGTGGEGGEECWGLGRYTRHPTTFLLSLLLVGPMQNDPHQEPLQKAKEELVGCEIPPAPLVPGSPREELIKGSPQWMHRAERI